MSDESIVLISDEETSHHQNQVEFQAKINSNNDQKDQETHKTLDTPLNDSIWSFIVHEIDENGCGLSPSQISDLKYSLLSRGIQYESKNASISSTKSSSRMIFKLQSRDFQDLKPYEAIFIPAKSLLQFCRYISMNENLPEEFQITRNLINQTTNPIVLSLGLEKQIMSMVKSQKQDLQKEFMDQYVFCQQKIDSAAEIDIPTKPVKISKKSRNERNSLPLWNSKEEILDALNRMELILGISLMDAYDVTKLADYILAICKSLAKKYDLKHVAGPLFSSSLPNVAIGSTEGIDLSGLSHLISRSSKVDPLTGEGVENAWFGQLMRFKHMSKDVAISICKMFPTPHSFLCHIDDTVNSLTSSLDSEPKEECLKNLQVTKGFGLLSSPSLLGSDLSKQLYKFFKSHEPMEFIS